MRLSSRKFEGHITSALAERTRVVNDRIHGHLGKTATLATFVSWSVRFELLELAFGRRRN